MSDSMDPRAAKAAAKAATAHAKALRPWWKKKRFWALGLIVVLILAASLSGGSEDEPADDATPERSEPTGTTLGDEAGEDTDVVLDSCEADDVGWTKITGTATNSSSKRSDYSFEIVVEVDSVQVASTFGSASNVEPGQKALWDTSTLEDHPAGATCRIVSVERNASL